MALTPERIARIRTFDELLAFLRDELNWPVPFDAALEDVSYPYDADELGLSSTCATLLHDSQIANLQPMTGEQPWGLFFIEFNTERVSVSALREVLRALVRKHPDRQAYEREDLLFICATRGFESFSFAHFQKREMGQPALETFGWNRGDQHLRTLCEFNFPHLRWLPEFARKAETWRKEWRAAFDVERVTQKFFADYRDVFAHVEAAIKGVPDDPTRRLFTQRLFNRLMFLYFLQKKGWMSFGGDTNYLRALFNAVQPGENFYASRLDATFFNGLNHFSGTPQDSEALRALRGEVPFLNGGLFERADAYDQANAVTIPNHAFARIFELFESYNFTVEESTPLDVQVSVDPEMLGKVFEELVTGRHETGSYYTPRPIVAFMCREALKGYLAPHDNEAALARFVDDGDGSQLSDPETVLEALKRVRVCDPACGSGAYLLGMMGELMRLRGALFVAHRIDADSDYEKKLGIIGQNLYGVDVDPFAVNIAMLRLWLSLIIEYEGPREKVPALPNLGYKIGCGDSLLAPNPNAFNLHAPEYARLCPQLEKLHDEMFSLGINRRKGRKTRDKAYIEADIARVEAEIRKLFGDAAPPGSFDWRAAFGEVFAPREQATTPFGTLNLGVQLAAAPEPGGFDIVLANPPYVRQELIKEIKPTLKAVYPDVYTGVADLYVYFYARALQLLQPSGMLAFISSNKWFRAGYGSNLRQQIADTAQVNSITDFNDLKVFQEADAYPMIFIAHKEVRTPQSVALTRWTSVKSLGPPYPDVRQLVAQKGQLLPADALSGSEWTLADAHTAKRLQTMRANGTPLGKYAASTIYSGIKTGLNSAFWIDSATRLY